jgi:hypothetical protein
MTAGAGGVLAVLDAAYTALVCFAETEEDNEQAEALLQARAAVAELIEAASGAFRNKPFAHSPAGQRLSAALARVKGGVA